MACGEFSLIARYFDRVKSARLDVETGIGDDCALLHIPEKKTLAISTDTLVAGNHFLPDIDPADLAYKALAVNLSDLAAMGAEPAWLTLALTLPEVDEVWLEAFSDSLFVQLDYYNLILVFDAYRVKGQYREVETVNGISIVYTKEAETADMYIEKVSHKLAKNNRVRVVTSNLELNHQLLHY